MTAKELALELLEKYKQAELSVIYWNGGSNDEEELEEEIEKYKKLINEVFRD